MRSRMNKETMNSNIMCSRMDEQRMHAGYVFMNRRICEDVFANGRTDENAKTCPWIEE